jgi:Domain of unknown function (DUF4193)
MTDDDFEEEAEPELDEESLDEEDLEDEEELEDDDDDLALEEGDAAAEEEQEEKEVVVAEPAAAAKSASGEEDDEGLDLDEELHPDDVEEPLDVLLQERTATITLEDDDEEAEEEEPDVDERGDGPTRIMPRRPGEFLCASCFLVLPRSQLADTKRMLCRDCA